MRVLETFPEQLQLAQLLGEHLSARLRDAPGQLARAQRTIHQRKKNDRLPLAANEFERLGHGTLVQFHTLQYTLSGKYPTK